jgi:hypothetical protein
VDTGHDFTVLDQLLPHPVYGWMSWVSVLNPSAATFDTVKPLLVKAYELAVGKFAKRQACSARMRSNSSFKPPTLRGAA